MLFPRICLQRLAKQKLIQNIYWQSSRKITTRNSVQKGKEFEYHKITGCVVAPFTPFKDNGDINFDCMERCVDYFTKSHINHLFVNGTLSEGMSLTVDERKHIAEAWVAATSGKLGMILHIGTGNLRDSKELALHAKDLGVQSIAAVSPSYYKPPTEEALVEYISEIASVTPALPLYYYCINYVTGVYLNTARFLELAKDRIPNLCGLKLTSPEMPHAQNCLMVDNKYQILFGTEDQFLPSLSLGMDVPITSPYLGPTFHKLKTAFDNGDTDEARRLQRTVQILGNIKARHGGGIAVSKTVFNIATGIDVGPVRLPLLNLPKEKVEKLRKDINALGIFSS